MRKVAGQWLEVAACIPPSFFQVSLLHSTLVTCVACHMVTCNVAAVRDVGGDDPGQREPAVRLSHRPHHDQVQRQLGHVTSCHGRDSTVSLASVDGLCSVFVFTNFLFSIFLDHLS